MAKILLVDDSKTSRKILRNLLEDKGHEIISEATNGAEAVEMFKTLKPDAVTMDITMPILNGIDALKQIMEIDKDAKVIMVTAAGQKSKMIDAIKFGASEFLTKPFESDQISDIVDKVLG